MKNEKKKRGRPPKIFTSEMTGLSYSGAINYALDKEVKSELEKRLASKDESLLTDEERKYLESARNNHTKTLNIRFTESEYQDIEEKCLEFGYKSKSTYVRDCVKARVNLPIDKADFAETNRQIKAIGNNINQIAVRANCLGLVFDSDVQEIKKGMNQIWQLLLSMQSKQPSVQQYSTSSATIRPSTVYMSALMPAEQTAEE